MWIIKASTQDGNLTLSWQNPTFFARSAMTVQQLESEPASAAMICPSESFSFSKILLSESAMSSGSLWHWEKKCFRPSSPSLAKIRSGTITKFSSSASSWLSVRMSIPAARKEESKWHSFL